MVKRHIKKSFSEMLLMFIIYATVIFFVFITLYPFLHVLSISLSSTAEAMKPGFHFFPKDITLQSYKKVLAMPEVGTAYLNSIFVLVVGTASNMLFTILAAYPLSRKKLVFRSQFMLIILFTMMFSGGLIPTYMLVRNLHLVNNRLVLIVLGLVSPYNMIIMKNFFQGIPDSLQESAEIDGASEWQILSKIVLPLSKPVIATIGLYYAVAHWNNFFTCTTYITDNDKMVLQVLLRKLIITSEMQFTDDPTLLEMVEQTSLPIQDKCTVVMVVTLPILLIYPFIQKYFAKGVLIGAVKG